MADEISFPPRFIYHSEKSSSMNNTENGRSGEERPSEKPISRPRPLGLLLLQDLILTALILLGFALVHHVLPQLNAAAVDPAAAIQTPLSELPGEETPAPADQAAPSPAPSEEPAADPADWRTKFAEHFTDEIVVSERTYSSPNLSIEIRELVIDDPEPNACFIADIYLARVDSFQTYWAGGKFHRWMKADPLEMSDETGAILCINGDYADVQETGLLVRNGELYMDEQTTCDICVLYADGTMETYGPEDYLAEEVLARGPYQIWKFGPALLDENGQPRSSFNTTDRILSNNPRTGIGYYEPGHYCFVVVDGRQGEYSAGMEIERFAQLFSELGCTAAYNLDGGRSSVMIFQQEIVNRPFLNGRKVGDILLIREPDED